MSSIPAHCQTRRDRCRQRNGLARSNDTLAESLKELYDYIQAKVDEEEISPAVGLYAIGWILFDLFEWLDLQKSRNPDVPLSPGLIDQWVREQPDAKIDREIENAEQSFGQAAILATEQETQRRITEAVNNSI